MKALRSKIGRSLIALMALFCFGCTTAIPAYDLADAVQGSTFTRQGEYLISAGDQLTIKVYGQEALSGVYPVSPSGLVTFPLIGFLQAAGETSLQLTDKLQRSLAAYVKNPLATVAVTGKDSLVIYFSGEFNRPGTAALFGRTTVLQAVAIGGGLTKAASGRIIVLRQMSNGNVRRYATTYARLLQGIPDLDRVTLERGDVLHAE